MNEDKLNIPDLWQKMADIGMNGWIADDEGQVIRQEIEKLEPGQVYLEIGVAFGKSLSTACYYAKEGVEIYGIDRLNWSQRDENMAKLGVSGRAKFIEGDSQQEAISWSKNKLIDLLFIDGDHRYYGVVFDMLSWIPLVKPNGRIMVHDYDPGAGPGIMKAVHDFIADHPAYRDQSYVRSIYTFTKEYKWI